MMAIDTGSFRDPFGCIFSYEGRILRSVFTPGQQDYEAARDKGVFQKLTQKGLLIAHRECELPDEAPQGSIYCLEHPRLPYVSYPWEWTFGMLKDAALLHLDIMEYLVPKGFWLRDASAFNVQYDGDRLRLIDTLSVGRRIADSPWVAYGQFCSHFLGPLALAAYRDIRTLNLWRAFIDGFPLDLVARMMPARARFRPGLLMHLFLHARFQQKAQGTEKIKQGPQAKPPKVSDLALIGLIRSLRRSLTGLRYDGGTGLWDAYGDIRTYGETDVRRKAEFVKAALEEFRPATVWDLGANRGEFSTLAAQSGAFTVAIEGDPACTEFIYRKRVQDARRGGLLPLHMDLANPSPDLGWDGIERLGLRRRAPAEMVFSLAIIHHLVLTNYVPMEKVAAWLHDLGRCLIVEFVPSGDPMVAKLLENRRGEHLPYDRQAFESSFGKYFEFGQRCELDNGRMLFVAHGR